MKIKTWAGVPMLLIWMLTPGLIVAQGFAVQMRAASGDLAVAETTSAVQARFGRLAILLDVTKLTLADVDDEVDFYIQTTYDAGANWCDAENIHFENADDGNTAKLIVRVGETDYLAADTAAACTDGTLADGTKLKVPLGQQVRIKTLITGATAPTYAYAAAGTFN